MMIPNIWENKECSKPPTRYDLETSVGGVVVAGNGVDHFHRIPQQRIKDDRPEKIPQSHLRRSGDT